MAFNSTYLAPNGKPSNLTPEQYRLVRSPEFKAWFGDWFNSPETSSKVVDSNGEPLVVYHGNSNINFNVFVNGELSVRGKNAKGWYFTRYKNIAKNFSGTNGFVKEVFLKIMNFKIAKSYIEIGTINKEYVKNAVDSGFDGAYFMPDKKSLEIGWLKLYNEEFVAFEPNQIKLADGTNTTFDGANPDIRFEQGGKVDLSFDVPNLDEEITWHELEYEFKTENNVKYVVQGLIRPREQDDIIHYTDINGVKKRRLKERADMVLSIQFATKSRTKDKYGNNNLSLRVKNKGEVYRVMATIVKIVKKILKEKTDITFVQFKPMGIDEGDNRRLILYTRAIQKEYPNSFIEKGYGEYVLDKKGFENFNRNFFGVKINRKQMKFKNGGRTISQTPSPTKDRVYGSQVNPKKSSSNLLSASKIEFSAETTKTIKNKVEKHNAEYPNKQITVESAKAVVRRGMGAYSNSHRPTISGGKPNSRFAWGLARLNAFIYKILNGKSKSGKYKQDDDLISELGYKVSRFDNGGKTDIPTRFFGSQAGGVLIYCKTTNRVLLLLRSPFVLEPFTWGTISGKVEGNEQIEETVRREAYEETGYQLKTLYPSYVFERPNFKFFNFISIVEQEFEPQLDWENIDYLWTSLDNLPDNMHFGLAELLKHGKIQETVKQLTSRFKKGG